MGSAAASASPAGLWRSIDDATGQPRSLVRIVEHGDAMVGTIEKLLIRPENPLCVRCPGERKDQPIEGLVIMREVRRGKDAGVWEGGQILDPKSGNEYSVRLTELDGGRRLKVRGFLGLAAFGRTQVWERVE
jgi:uncharacterized protein (DUF2147 family)